jgi:endonuclease YncB( thermonuclease family)
MMFKSLPITGLLLAVAVIGPDVSWADFKASVVTVHEGDRVTIYHNGRSEMIYLKNIDCPELKQPYGKQATRTTLAYIGGREVVIHGLQRDRQGRTTADVLLQDGRNIGHELVKEGLAWARQETTEGRRLGEIEQLARAEHKGLWSDSNPVPPWKWKQKTKVKR